MKIHRIAILAPILAAAASCQQSSESSTGETEPVTEVAAGNASSMTASAVIAQAMLAIADGAARGIVRVSEKPEGLTVNIQAMGFVPGRYGVHVHDVGKCDGPDFKTAEGHWNPAGTQHGFDNPKGAHQGDLPNLTIAADGMGIVDFAIPGASAQALLDADGAAIIVHAGPDDLKTDPSGDSGARIACGVLIAPE